MKLIVGLGNPGTQYENTRHNVGFKAVDHIGDRLNFIFSNSKFNAEIASGQFAGEKYFLLKPTTYMNLSGQSVRAVMDYYKIPLDDICVIHDDLDLDLANVKVKRGGGHGGHNGLRSLDSHVGKDYLRIRIGIDRPADKDDVSNYVLRNFSQQQLLEIDEVLCNITKHVEDIFTDTHNILAKKLNK